MNDAVVFDEIANQLDEARKSAAKPKHPWLHVRRAGIQCGRLVIQRLEEAVLRFGPVGIHLSVAEDADLG